MWLHLITPRNSKLMDILLSHCRSYPGDSQPLGLILFIKNTATTTTNLQEIEFTHVRILFFRDRSKTNLFQHQNWSPQGTIFAEWKVVEKFIVCQTVNLYLLRFCIVLYKQVLQAKAKPNSKRSLKTRHSPGQNILNGACEQIKLSEDLNCFLCLGYQHTLFECLLSAKLCISLQPMSMCTVKS